MASFNIDNISKKDKKILQRMTGADPATSERLKQGTESSRAADARISSGETRTSESGQKTRTKPSARNTSKGVAADRNFYKKLEIGTERGAAAQQQAAIDMKSQVKKPISSSPKISSGFADLNKQIDKVKPKVTTRQGRLSNQADEVLKQIRATKSKPTAVKQSDVSKRAERFRQSFGTPTGANPRTGVPTYRPLATTTNLPKGVGGRAPSSRQYSNVKVGDLNAKEILKNKGTGASSSTTTSGSKLPKIKSTPVKTIAKVKQSMTKPAPKLQSTPGKTLKFGQTSGGSFSYKPGNNPVSVVADPTRRRASGAAGPSSRIGGGPKVPPTKLKPITPQQARQPTQVPNLGKGSTSPRTGESVSYKPSKVKAPKSQSSGVGSGAFYGVFNAMSAAEREKARGQTAERQRNAALASGTGSTLGSVVATKALSSLLGPKLKAITNIAGPLIGSGVGSQAADYVMGASASDKKWMAKQNRKLQTGVPGLSATSRSGNKSVIRDKSGKERVGYLAYKDGKPVYKTANDPSSLAYTSSNPLERVGRRTADSGVPYVSDLLKGYYGRKDDATKKSNVAAQKSRAGN